MVAKTWSATLKGIDGEVVGIESSCQLNLPKIQITGLPSEAIRESRERVRSCLAQFGFDVPSKHILIHLWPANSKKSGNQFDLAIAMAVLGAEGLVDLAQFEKTAFLGEMTIAGELLPVTGVVGLLQVLVACPHIETVVLPLSNAWEASLLNSPKTKTARHLGEVLDFLNGKTPLAAPMALSSLPVQAPKLMDQIRGNPQGKRAIEIALAGRHHLLLIGAPGVGKTMLARSAVSLLPPLNSEEVPIVLKNYCLYPHEKRGPSERPFRAPHHSISPQGLLGGGKGDVLPGEVTLAHLGVLFLDEFPEFRRDSIEGLREPLQNGHIRVQRIGAGAPLPALFSLIVAMNPCPCGYALSSQKMCRCSRDAKNKYQQRISGPILERLDLYVTLHFNFNDDEPESPRWWHEAMQTRIAQTIETQRQRYGVTTIRNSNADVHHYGEAFTLNPKAQSWWKHQAENEATNHRMLDKLLRVARTIADLDGAERIDTCHLQEAWLFRLAPPEITGWR